MTTYLYIDELFTGTAQKRYRNGFELRQVDYELNRAISQSGVIISDVTGGRIKAVIHGFGNEDLFNWLFDPAKKKSGEVVTTDSFEKVIGKFTFTNARAIKYRLHYDANTKSGISAELVIEAGEIATENELQYKRK